MVKSIDASATQHPVPTKSCLPAPVRERPGSIEITTGSSSIAINGFHL